MDKLPSPGLFWLPNDDDNKLFGQLEGNVGSIRLSLIGRLEDQSAQTITVTTTYFEDLERIPIVYGIIRGSLVTLINLAKSKSGWSAPGFEESRYKPEFVVFGKHLSQVLDEQPVGITVRLSHLLYWHGTRGLTQTSEGGEAGWTGAEWRYSYPSSTDWTVPGLNISLMGGLDPSNRVWDSVNITEYGYFRVRSEATKTIRSWYESVIEPLHEMVRFSVFDTITLDRVKLLFPDGVGTEETHLLDHYEADLVINRKPPRTFRPESNRQPDLLFRPSALTSESLEAFLQTEIQTARVRRRFIANEQREMQPDEFFLAYIRLLESFHRLLFPIDPTAISAHKSRVERIITLVNEADRSLVERSLAHAYEPTLGSRLHELAKP